MAWHGTQTGSESVYMYILRFNSKNACVGIKNLLPTRGLLGQDDAFYGLGRDEGQAHTCPRGVSFQRGR